MIRKPTNRKGPVRHWTTPSHVQELVQDAVRTQNALIVIARKQLQVAKNANDAGRVHNAVKNLRREKMNKKRLVRREKP